MATRPHADIVKSCLPRNGMKWHHGTSVTRRNRIDVSVVVGLRSLGVSYRQDVQIALTNLVDEASKRVDLVPGRDVDRLEFVREFAHHHRLGQVLPPAHFEQIFTTIVLARYRYRMDRWDEDLPDEDPATHCHLARAVDTFEKAAWFWSTTEGFFEDYHTRADEPSAVRSRRTPRMR
ncbi:hypothetical protein N658DRAFT_434462 [Parathielavia hyrcaniae]|uniref:Uncharacterized protein n=1 Tax=Parathielavia hyrcaniae TaxID=113614 RepID=A0AAN6PSQ6_9PEZI|nr:hypothetical protein N658DRAFT_434462 [Parathielavia hyrcaniae]